MDQCLIDRMKELKSDKSIISYLDMGSKGGLINTKISRLAATSLKPKWQAKAIAGIVKFMHADLVIELGTSFGITTSMMHLDAPEARIISIEGIEQIHTQARKTMALFPNSNVELKWGSFDEILPEIIALPSKNCFAFVDGNHRYKPTIKYVKLLAQIKSEALIVAIDDIYASREMEMAWHELIKSQLFHGSIDFYHFGVLIKRNGLSEQHLKLKL